MYLKIYFYNFIDLERGKIQIRIVFCEEIRYDKSSVVGQFSDISQQRRLAKSNIPISSKLTKTQNK